MKEHTGTITRLNFIICQKSLQSEKDPDDWKEARQHTQSKKVKKNPDNYRTVSFTSVKVM